MRLPRQFFLMLGLSLIAATASASISAPQNGVEFTTLARPQPTEAGKKVEVIEFFGYFCPHCNALDPLLADWLKKNGDRVSFKRVHVDAFHDRTVAQQRLFATLDAMGKLEENHAKVFHAVHVERQRLASDAEVIDFAVNKLGLERQAFTDTYRSFTVGTKLSRSRQMAESYGIPYVPTLVVDGRLATAPDLAAAGMRGASEREQDLAAVQVLDVLVAQQQKARADAAARTAK